MASERQKAANRRNAAKSSGPRSASGRRRAGGNSYRHGFAASFAPNRHQARRVEKLARKIAGDAADSTILEYAHSAAQAQLDLERVRRVKVATIDQVLAMGRLGGCQLAGEGIAAILRALIGDESINRPPDDEAPRSLPSEDPDRTAEAIRKALPELIKLDRYEHNAVIRRERAMRAIYATHDFNV